MSTLNFYLQRKFPFISFLFFTHFVFMLFLLLLLVYYPGSGGMPYILGTFISVSFEMYVFFTHKKKFYIKHVIEI